MREILLPFIVLFACMTMTLSAQTRSRQTSIAVMQQIAKEMNSRCPERQSNNLIMKSVKYSNGQFNFSFRYTDPDALKSENSKLYLYVFMKYAYASNLGKIVFKPNLEKSFSIVKPSFVFTTYNKVNHITHNISYEDVVNAKIKTDKGENAWPSMEEMQEEYVRTYVPIHEVDSVALSNIRNLSKMMPYEICEGLMATNIYLGLDRVMTLEFYANKSMIDDEEKFMTFKYALFAQLGKAGVLVASLIRGNYSLRYIYKDQEDGRTVTEVTFSPSEVYDLYKYFNDKDLGVF